MQKKKKFYHHFKSEVEKINKDVKLYYYLRLINILKQTVFNARIY